MNKEGFTKKVLDDIHSMITYNHGQNYLFNGCMGYLMECLKENKAYDYWFFSNVLGDSFTQLYKTHKTDVVSSLSQDCFDYDYARRAFDACGYDFTYVDQAELMADQPRVLQMIVDSINLGVPVLTKGFEGSNAFTIVCGYENEGDVLYYLMDDLDEPKKYANGLNQSKALIFAGDKNTDPPLADVYRQAVMSIPHYMTMPRQNGITFGKQAFDDWADNLLDEVIWDGIMEVNFDKLRWRHHCDYLCMVGTNGCSRDCLAKALELNPDMEIIHRLQPIYENMQQVYHEICRIQAEDGTSWGFFITMERLKSRDVRQRISEKIREFSRCCDEILGVFSRHDL